MLAQPTGVVMYTRSRPALTTVAACVLTSAAVGGTGTMLIGPMPSLVMADCTRLPTSVP